METVGEAREIALLVRLDDAQRVARDVAQPCGVERRFLRDEQTRQAQRLVERLLRDANVDDDGSGRRLFDGVERRQGKAALGRNARALCETQLAQRFRRGETASLAAENMCRFVIFAQRGEGRRARQGDAAPAPMRRRLFSPIRTEPSSAGETFAPARRSRDEKLLREEPAARGDEILRLAAPRRRCAALS